MTLNDLEWPFYVNVHYYKQHFQRLFYILTVETICRIFIVVSRDQQRCAEADHDPQNILGWTADLLYTKSWGALHRWNLNK